MINRNACSTNRNKFIAVAAMLAALAALLAGEGGCHAAEVRNPLALAKCRLIVKECYPASGFLPYCEYLVDYHRRLETEGLRKRALGCKGYKFADGYSTAWYWSLVYGGANFSLKVGGIAPGGCAGPFDVKHLPRVLDPEKNTRWHCEEMWGFYKRGVRGRDLCEAVYYPARPHGWDRKGDGNTTDEFVETDARHRAVIQEAYREGVLR